MARALGVLLLFLAAYVAVQAQNQRCPSNTGMTDNVRTRFLRMHNNRREALAKGIVARRNGNKLPRAANMRRMRYNCALEMQVTNYLSSCPTTGSAESTRTGVGENFITFPETGISTPNVAARMAVTSWWKTIRTTQGIGNAVTFRSHHVNTPIASFTQMAWAGSDRLGCSVNRCNGRYVVACRYSPNGNRVGRIVYARGAPCSACPSGARCTNNALCTLP